MHKINTKSLIILQTIGIGFVAMPHLSAVLAGRDGLVAICLATFFAMLYLVTLLTVFKRYGGLDLFGISELVLDKKLALTLCYGFIVKGVLFSGFCLRVLGETVTKVIESPVPAIYVMLALALCVVYATTHGLEVCSRLAEVCLVPFLLVISLVFACGLKDGKVKELLPVFAQSGGDILKATLPLFLWFYPIQGSPVQYLPAKKGSVKAVLLSGLVIAVVFAVTLMHFGIAQMTSLDYPVLEMMYSVSLPSSFIERQEGLMLGIWTIGVFFAISGTLCRCIEATSLGFKGTSRGITSIICTIAVMAVALLPKNGATAYRCMLNTVLVGEGIYFVGLPLVLCLYTIWEDKANVDKNT